MASAARRSASARIAVLARIRQGKTNTEPGREAAEQRFVDQVLASAEGELSPEELRKRVAAARKEHFARMAYRSLKAREAKAAQRKRESAAGTDTGAL
jgi:hypothetical protein